MKDTGALRRELSELHRWAAQSYPAMLARGDKAPRVHVEQSENGELHARDFDL